MNAKHTVLVVDDDPLVLESLRRQLQLDYEVVTSTEPTAQLASDTRFDAVIADYFMPHMTGAEFLAEVKRQHPRAARLLITGGTDLKVAVDAVNQAAVHALLPKPITAHQLKARLRETITPLPQRDPTAGAQPAANPQRPLVLIVDDSQTALESTELLLDEAGYRTLTLGDPFRLLGLLRTKRPDVVLLDVNMPALDGPRLLEALRGYDFLKKTKVFLHSSLDVDHLRAEAERCRADGFLQKGSPTFVQDLTALLDG